MNGRSDDLIAWILREHGLAEPLAEFLEFPTLYFGHIEELHILVRQMRTVVSEKDQHARRREASFHMRTLVRIRQTHLARLEQRRMRLMVEHQV